MVSSHRREAERQNLAGGGGLKAMRVASLPFASKLFQGKMGTLGYHRGFRIFC
jgi:hypothetical protein